MGKKGGRDPFIYQFYREEIAQAPKNNKMRNFGANRTQPKPEGEGGGSKNTSGCLAKEAKRAVALKVKILCFSFSSHRKHNSTQKCGALIIAHCPKRHPLLELKAER